MQEGEEEVSPDFSKNLMARIENRKVEIPPYQPLIPNYAWAVILGLFSVLMLGVYLNILKLDLALEKNIFEFPEFPEIELSHIMLYGIGFVSLFFLEIPFLKRLLAKQYDTK